MFLFINLKNPFETLLLILLSNLLFDKTTTILILLGVTYYNYQFKDSLYEGNEITHKISREEIAKIESSTMFESLFLEDQEVDYFFNMYVANQIVDE